MRAPTRRLAAAYGGLLLAALGGCVRVLDYPDETAESSAVLCSDGNDNDFDGKADCEDAECNAFCHEVACESYCDLAMANCTEANAVFSTRETCMGFCKVLPLGEAGAPGNDNTVVCRAEQALKAGMSEPGFHCNGAGPGGGNLCGSDCESFCYLLERVCPLNFEADNLTSPKDCLDKCRALRDDPVLDNDGFTGSFDKDTVECRVFHLALATSNDGHCSHGDFQSSLHCSPRWEEGPSCSDFCRVVMVACQGANAVYDDVDTCIATCEELELGTNEDFTENTVGCRHYQAYNAIANPASHCSHAGPTGAGHCGEIEGGTGPCDSYCRLAKAGCKTAYEAAFPGGDDECRAECALIPGAADDLATTDRNETEQFSVTLAESKDPNFALQCRVLYATRAVLAGESELFCGAALALDGWECPPKVD